MRVLQRSRGGLRRSTKSKSAVRSIDPSRAANRGPSLTGIIKRHSRVYARAFRYRTMRDSATELNVSSRRDRRAKGKRDRERERERFAEPWLIRSTKAPGDGLRVSGNGNRGWAATFAPCLPVRDRSDKFVRKRGGKPVSTVVHGVL